MSVAKVIEIIAEGKTLENAMESGLKEAAKSVKNIKSMYTEGIQAVVVKDKIKSYRINLKVTFIVGK